MKQIAVMLQASTRRLGRKCLGRGDRPQTAQKLQVKQVDTFMDLAGLLFELPAIFTLLNLRLLKALHHTSKAPHRQVS